MARFTESRLDEKNNFTETYKHTGKWLLSLLVIVFIVLAVFAGITAARPALATDTDWHDNEVSEQIQHQAREQARKLWREENGDFQPNLTPAAEKEMQAYTAQKQAEINRTLEHRNETASSL